MGSVSMRAAVLTWGRGGGGRAVYHQWVREKKKEVHMCRVAQYFAASQNGEHCNRHENARRTRAHAHRVAEYSVARQQRADDAADDGPAVDPDLEHQAHGLHVQRVGHLGHRRVKAEGQAGQTLDVVGDVHVSD